MAEELIDEMERPETQEPRDVMDYDVVIVGGGPAGLSAAIRLKQLAAEAGREISVALLEKGSEVGAHILSGAVIDPRALEELFPDWRGMGAPLETPVTKDRILYLGPQGSFDMTWLPMPGFMKNHGCFIASLANLCRWLSGQAEALGVEIYPGMAATEMVFEPGGALKGVVAGIFGIGKDGVRKPDYQPGVELHGKYTLLAEGCRGSLSKIAQRRFGLNDGRDPQKYGIGLKEIWQVPDGTFQKGLVQHTLGWPLDDRTAGGSWIYHFGENYVSIGLVVDLSYANPHLSPFDEFQRFKHHPEIRRHLEGGRRIAYGARAIVKGGVQSLPKLSFPGGVLIGDSAGFVNQARVKGSHNAVKTGMLGAESVFKAIGEGRELDDVSDYERAYQTSWVAQELHLVRNNKPLGARFGTVLGAILLGGVDLTLTNLTRGWSPFGTLHHTKSDAEATGLAKDYKPIAYPKPDNVLSFDKLSSVFISNTNHEEDQPAHLRLLDPSIPIAVNLPKYGEPARLYCPAGVYEVIYNEQGQDPRFQINAQNCVHCKTCDIKDPSQNIVWTTPEGGGGPNYPNM